MLDERDAGCLRDEWNRARRAWVRLEHVELVAGERELQVEQTACTERARDPGRGRADRIHMLRSHARRRNDDRRVARMAARPLDMLEDRGDPCLLAVAEDVDVELD